MGTNRIDKKIYRLIDVWERNSDECAVRYRCFEVLGTNKYCVQSADFFSIPITDSQLFDFNEQFLELFLEAPPDKRAGVYSTLEEAIQKHKEEFKK